MRKPYPAPAPTVAALAGVLLTLTACAINPATGKRQLVLVSEGREARMGRDSDRAVSTEFGIYGDEQIQRYIEEVGRKLAVNSERPDLDWTFRVVDDPLVNAFALPGGYIYVTRGILAHFNSEAELAAVLAHEIGHVTARHSVNQMSKAQLAQLGLGVGMVLSEGLREVGDVARTGLGVLFLKFSRDDERQADDLGLRYVARAGYDPRPMVEVFATLKRVSEVGGGDRPPGWLSTHPDPEDRELRTSRAIAAMNRDFTGGIVRRDEYLRTIDGLVFGKDPRHGFFQGRRFVHPDMEFRIDFPDGWKLRNLRQSVSGMSPDRDALLRVTVSDQDTAAGALRTFMDREGVARTGTWNREVHGLNAEMGTFTAVVQNDTLAGEVAFVEHDGRVFGVIGFSAASRWGRYRSAVTATLLSFQRLTDRRALDVEPQRLHVVRPEHAMSPQEFADHYAATAPPRTLAVVNGLEAGAPFQAGHPYKVIQGGKLP